MRRGKQIKAVLLDDDSDAKTVSSDDGMDVDHDHSNNASQSSSVQTQKTTTEEEPSDAHSPEHKRPLRGATLGNKRSSSAQSSPTSSPPASRRFQRNETSKHSSTPASASRSGSGSGSGFGSGSGSTEESESELEVEEVTPPRRPGRPRTRAAPSSGDDIDMLPRKSSTGKFSAKVVTKGKGKERARDEDSSGDESEAVEYEEENEPSEDEDSDKPEVQWAGQLRPQHLHTTVSVLHQPFVLLRSDPGC